MFPALRTEVEARFSHLEALFTAARDLKGRHQAAIKGLMFVQTYAVYEYTVNSVVKETIEAINAHKHRYVDLAPTMMALFLDPEWDSLRDSGRRREWESRLKILDRAFSRERVALSSDTGLPNDGSHYRYTHLQLIFRVFGIDRLAVRRRAHIPRITEVVDYRNEIAHGAETAEDVGRRYSRLDIRKVIRQMKSVCLFQISVFETFCAEEAPHLRK